MPGTIRDAMTDGHIYVAMQPLVDLHKREVFGYEALVRSRTPDFPDPPTILRAAVGTRFMGELGRELRRMAVEACPTAHLFLNLHPSEFDEGWLVRPDDAIFTHDMSIFLEITESVPLSHFKWCHSVLREVRSKGVFLAVDDLGAGYSNFKYIADLSPEVVKLDRELIAGLGSDRRLQKLVVSLVKLCVDLGAKVVAEGIETEEEFRAVRDTGAHYGQGYLLARPAFPPPKVNWGPFTTERKSPDRRAPERKIPERRTGKIKSRG